ncbi:hypothetical protein LV779_34655 [Streptomyces thinghirensis]|nr:hypothetical protein [Streptomyces thinghirensis]
MERFTIDPAALRLPRHAEPVDLAYAAVSSFADGSTNETSSGPRPGAAPRLHEPRGPVPLPDLNRRDVRTGAPVATGEPACDGEPAPTAEAHRCGRGASTPATPSWTGTASTGAGCCPASPGSTSCTAAAPRPGTGRVHRGLALREPCRSTGRSPWRRAAPWTSRRGARHRRDAWRITVTDAVRGDAGAPEPYVTADVHRRTAPPPSTRRCPPTSSTRCAPPVRSRATSPRSTGASARRNWSTRA